MNGRRFIADSSAFLISLLCTLTAAEAASRASQPPTAPTFILQPSSQAIASGTTVVFNAEASANPSPTYQWYENGAPISGATGVRFVIAGATAANIGSYACVASNSAGSATSNAASLSITGTSNPGRIVNFSILSYLQGSLTMGFVTGGSGKSGSENLLIRATGPALSLAPFNIAGVLPDPTLVVVRQSNGAILASNSGWGTPASNQTQVIAADNATGAFALTNPASLDSALVDAFPSVGGGYCAIVAGRSGDSGYALTEVYDDTTANALATPRLINTSCLTQIGSGGILTAGFVIGGSSAETVLVRATGPALALPPFNVGGVIPDPQIVVRPLGVNTVLASNAGWGGDPQITTVGNSVGAFPLTQASSLDSAVLLTLAPGPYTAQVSSVSGASGTTLVEVYEVQPVTATSSSDTTPPSVPTGLSATAVSSSQINLSWTASTDNVGVAGYQIFRNGSEVGTSTSTSFVDSGLAPSTTDTYTVAAFDAAGNVSGQSASVSATTSAQPLPTYPIELSTSGTYLVDQNNQPFFIVGDAPQLLCVQISNADVETYLADRAARGFNSLWVYPVDKVDQSNAPLDYYGDTPFDGADFTNEDPAYWAHVDSVIQRIAAYGMTAWIDPGFVGLVPSNGYLSSYVNSSDAIMTAYGAWLGNRYKNFPNIVWTLGGDADPANTAAYQKLSDLANGIRSADTVHLITFEASRFTNGQAVPSGGYSSLDAWNPPPSWLNLNWVYQTGPTVAAGAANNYARTPWLPPLMGEDWYELDPSMSELQLRQEGYEAVLAGTYLGRFFGNDAIWTFDSPNDVPAGTQTWQSQLGSAGSIGQANLGALFRSREHWKLVPDLSNTVLTSGYQSGSTLALAARTSDGQSIIAYIPTQRTVTIDFTKISDTSANAWWFNPQTASSTLIGTFPTTGPQNFTPPDQNDWVLVIDAASALLPAPGTSVYRQ